MRKKAKYIVAALLMFCFATSVKAEQCSYERQVELGEEASTVKVAYDLVDYDTGQMVYVVDPETGEVDITQEEPLILEYFKIKIMNLTENVYVQVVDLDAEEEETIDDFGAVSDDALKQAGYYFYSDSDKGTVYLDPISTDYIHEYKILVYSADPECGDKQLRTINYKTPMFNNYSTVGYCKKSPEFEYCQKYVSEPLDITLTDFLEEYRKYEAKEKENEKKNSKTTIKSFYKKNKKVIMIAGGCILIAGVATAAIIVIRRRSRLI